eukprot:11215339-Lingulodinium_polyedra.AAC.1
MEFAVQFDCCKQIYVHGFVEKRKQTQTIFAIGGGSGVVHQRARAVPEALLAQGLDDAGVPPRAPRPRRVGVAAVR